MNKTHNERNAGRKPSCIDGVRFGGGMMPRYIYEIVKVGFDGLKGMGLVNAALEFYLNHHTNHTQEK